MTMVLNRTRTIDLLKKLGCELGWRAREDYDQLFDVSTVSQVYSLLHEVENTVPVSSDEQLRRRLHDELVKILQVMGVKLSDGTHVHDDLRNLSAVRDAISAINDDANRGVFIEHELTCLTANIKSKLTRRIDCLRAVVNSWKE